MTTSDNTEQDPVAAEGGVCFDALMDAYAQLTPQQEEQLARDNEEIELAADAYALGREYLERGQRKAAERWLRIAARHRLDQAQLDLDRLDCPDLDGSEGPSSPAAPELPHQFVIPRVCDPQDKKGLQHDWDTVASPSSSTLVGGYGARQLTRLLVGAAQEQATKAQATRILTHARREADLTLNSAHTQAQDILTHARREADLTLNSAHTQAQDILTHARREADPTLNCDHTQVAVAAYAVAHHGPTPAASSVTWTTPEREIVLMSLTRTLQSLGYATDLVRFPTIPARWPIKLLIDTCPSVHTPLLERPGNGLRLRYDLDLPRTTYFENLKEALQLKDGSPCPADHGMLFLLAVADAVWRMPEAGAGGHSGIRFPYADPGPQSSCMDVVVGTVVAVRDDPASAAHATVPLALPSGGRGLPV